jgi:hypothetical protein
MLYNPVITKKKQRTITACPGTGNKHASKPVLAWFDKKMAL